MEVSLQGESTKGRLWETDSLVRSDQRILSRRNQALLNHPSSRHPVLQAEGSIVSRGGPTSLNLNPIGHLWREKVSSPSKRTEVERLCRDKSPNPGMQSSRRFSLSGALQLSLGSEHKFTTLKFLNLKSFFLENI